MMRKFLVPLNAAAWTVAILVTVIVLAPKMVG